MPQASTWVKRIGIAVLGVACAGAIYLLAANALVKWSADGRILAINEAAALQDADCILVLGCGVRPDGSPSPMLEDRILTGIALYRADAAPKLLMSGDHGRIEYNEVGLMKQIAVEAGVPSEDVFMDHAGFSTYESLRRARDVFGARKIVIVSQEYHLPRALYIAQQLGLEAYGVPANLRPYAGQSVRDAREVLARAKDLVTAVVEPDPTFLGPEISLEGSGDVTND